MTASLAWPEDLDVLLDEPDLRRLLRVVVDLARAELPGAEGAFYLAGPEGTMAPPPGERSALALKAFHDAAPAVDRAAVALPLGERAGALVLEPPDPGAVAGAPLARLAALAARAGLFVAKAVLYEQTRQEPRPILMVGVEPSTAEAAFRAAAFDTPVLVRGETGTGKELLARALHVRGPRRRAPFEAVNCSALRGPLALAELFGHTRGAFTDAVADRPGVLEVADGGTLFLDEIERMPPDSQALLLRVIETQEFSPVGAAGKKRRVNVRFVAATNADIERRLEDGSFLPDLYYRVAGVTLRLAPLRERRAFIPRLAARTLEGLPSPRTLAEPALRALQNYDYPGNIRELQNVVTEAFIRDRDGRIDLDDLPERLRTAPILRLPPRRRGDDRRRDVESALHACGGNVRRAAALYGVSRTRFYVLMRALGIDPGPFRTSKGA